MGAVRSWPIFAVLVCAACGGSGAETSENLTAAEFRQQASAIRSQAYGELRSLGSPQSPEALRTFVEKALPIQEEALERNRALNPPDELAADWNRVLEVAENDFRTTQELNDALNEGDLQRAQDALAELGSLNQQGISALRALDLTACINPMF